MIWLLSVTNLRNTIQFSLSYGSISIRKGEKNDSEDVGGGITRSASRETELWKVKCCVCDIHDDDKEKMLNFAAYIFPSKIQTFLIYFRIISTQ